MEHAALLADESPDGPLARVVSACREAGVPAGAFAGSSPEAARALLRHGFTWVSVVTDATVLSQAGSALVRDAREG
jgi:4-hydroxy-2-oxoheptanedioate aldolase